MSEWRDVPGFDGWYQCSSEGAVRSFKGGSERMMKLSSTRGGYLFVSLRLNGEYRAFRINRLVLLCFRGQPRLPEMQACHRNGDHLDNRLANLYWGTAIENAADKRRHGTHQVGERSALARLTGSQVLEARILYATHCCTQADLAWHYGVSAATIGRAVSRRTYREVS